MSQVGSHAVQMPVDLEEPFSQRVPVLGMFVLNDQQLPLQAQAPEKFSPLPRGNKFKDTHRTVIYIVLRSHSSKHGKEPRPPPAGVWVWVWVWKGMCTQPDSCQLAF